MNDPANFDLTAYLDATLGLHGLVLDEARKREVENQLRLLMGMAKLIDAHPLPTEIEPANTFHP